MKKEKDFVEVGMKDKSRSEKESFARVLTSFTRVVDKLKGEEVNIDLLDGLLASEDIDSEIDKVSVGYMLMSSMAAYAEERYENKKMEIKHYAAQLDEQAREGEITARVTDAKVVAWINRDSKYNLKVRKLNEYHKQMQIYEAAARAYDIKSRMLQTKSANFRKIQDVPEVNSRSKASKAYDTVTGKSPTKKG